MKEVGVRPAAGQVTCRNEVLDRLGIEERAREVGVLAQQAQQAAVTGALSARAQGQPCRRQVRALAEGRLQRELDALLGDLVALESLPGRQRIACQGQADQLARSRRTPTCSCGSEAAAYPLPAASGRSRSTKAASSSPSRPEPRAEPGLGRLVEELQRVAVREQRAVEVRREAAHQRGLERRTARPGRRPGCAAAAGRAPGTWRGRRLRVPASCGRCRPQRACVSRSSTVATSPPDTSPSRARQSSAVWDSRMTWS